MSYTEIADYILDQVWGYQGANLLKNNVKYLTDEVFNYPQNKSNQVSMGARSPGWTSNLEIVYSGSTLTLTGWGGIALSATNPGWICVPSTTAGKNVTLKVTYPFAIKDSTHASPNLTGALFGQVTTSDWAEDLLFSLVAVNRNDTDFDGVNGNSSIGITRNPIIGKTDSSNTVLGDTTAVNTLGRHDSSIIFMASLTKANYTLKPAQTFGCFRMRYASAGTAWTIQSFDSCDGVGPHYFMKSFAKIWNYPTLQNGATVGYFFSAAGTIPTFSSNVCIYQILPNGIIKARLAVSGDGGTDGAVASPLIFWFPTESVAHSLSGIHSVGRIRYAGGATYAWAYLRDSLGNAQTGFYDLNGNQWSCSDFPNGNRSIEFVWDYQAFKVMP